MKPSAAQTLGLLALIVTCFVVAIVFLADLLPGVSPDPYIVPIASSRVAPPGAQPGFHMDHRRQTLHVFSDQEVILVADPAASAEYKTVWILERPVPSPSGLAEVIYDLRTPIEKVHINPPTMPAPDHIRHAARME